MKLFMILATGAALAAFMGCTKTPDNPFFSEYNTPYGVPPFDKIQPEHYLPAIEEGIKQHLAEIDIIVNNAEAPTFANTIEELEYSGELIDRVALTFYNINSSDATPVIDSLANIIMPMITAHADNIFLNEKLFAKIKAVYNQRESLGLTLEQLRLVEKTYEDFARGGAELVGEPRERLRAINERISKLELAFNANVRADNNAFLLVMEKSEELVGLPEGVIAAAADEAKQHDMEGKWVFTLNKPSLLPFLQYSQKRNLREQMLVAYMSKGNHNNANDNKENIIEQVSLRTEKAQLLGFDSYAAYTIANKMAKTPERVNDFLAQIWSPALALAKKEAADMQALINKEETKFTLESWDWGYYADKVRINKYNLNEEELLSYFSLDNVLQGAFDLANKLFGLNFTQVHDLPLYNPEATTYIVKNNADGAFIGVLYFDFHPRATKSVGAWMTEFRSQHRSRDGKDIRPVVSIVCNFTKPTGNTPALLSIDEVETLFHEFGHALHGLSSQCTYASLSGTNVPTDFVELPSQIMENWATHPDVLKLYARHYQTGEIIPDELIEKMQKSSTFNQGFATVENVAACMLDMAYHCRTTTDKLADIATFEKQLLDKIGAIRQVPPRYHSTYFKHIFELGYTAGYYSYIWSQVLDADAFAAFVESGNVLNADLGMSFRNKLLSRGNTEDPMELYKKFRGKEPDPSAMMKRKGMI